MTAEELKVKRKKKTWIRSLVLSAKYYSHD